MGTEVMVPGVAYVSTVVAMTVFLWRVFGKRFDAIDVRQERFEAWPRGRTPRNESRKEHVFASLASAVAILTTSPTLVGVFAKVWAISCIQVRTVRAVW